MLSISTFCVLTHNVISNLNAIHQQNQNEQQQQQQNLITKNERRKKILYTYNKMASNDTEWGKRSIHDVYRDKRLKCYKCSIEIVHTLFIHF